jgi:hypothetical protein
MLSVGGCGCDWDPGNKGAVFGCEVLSTGMVVFWVVDGNKEFWGYVDICVVFKVDGKPLALLKFHKELCPLFLLSTPLILELPLTQILPPKLVVKLWPNNPPLLLLWSLLAHDWNNPPVCTYPN